MESLLNKVADLKVCNVIKKRLQHRCFPEYSEIIKSTYFVIVCEWLLLPLEVFCKDFVDISYENASFGLLEDYMAASYLTLNYNCTLAYEISCGIMWCQGYFFKNCSGDLT